MPYVFTILAKVTGGFKPRDNQNPRDFLAKTTGLAARANAVQQNSFESLPLFIAAVLMAEYMVSATSHHYETWYRVYCLTYYLWYLLFIESSNITLDHLVFVDGMSHYFDDYCDPYHLILQSKYRLYSIYFFK